MTSVRICATAIAIASAPCLAHGQTSFSKQEIVVSGNADIDAVSINRNGAIVATLFDTATGTQSGIVLNGGTATVLSPPYAGGGAPIPTAINARGDVLGYDLIGTQPFLFLYRAGQYQTDAEVPLEIGPIAVPPLPTGLNRTDAVFYTIITGQNNPTDPIYGKFPNVRSMPPLMEYQTAHSINATGVLAGTTFRSPASDVFVGRGANFMTLLPPGAVSADGGYVNDADEVAGTYTDGTNTQHGFTYQNGTYTSFDLPEPAQPYSVVVMGLNNAGRVVGLYTSAATNEQRGFLFNGRTATAFGQFSRNDTIAVTLNDREDILVAREIYQNPNNYQSYLVKCSGTGC